MPTWGLWGLFLYPLMVQLSWYPWTIVSPRNKSILCPPPRTDTCSQFHCATKQLSLRPGLCYLCSNTVSYRVSLLILFLFCQHIHNIQVTILALCKWASVLLLSHYSVSHDAFLLRAHTGTLCPLSPGSYFLFKPMPGKLVLLTALWVWRI